MNKTIITEKIDGYDIIKGFGYLTIDPVETKKKVFPVIEATGEAAALKAKSKEMASKAELRISAVQAAKEAFKNGNTSLYAKHEYEATQRQEELNVLQEEIIELYKNLESKRQQIWKDSVVYFEPKKGELLLEDETLLQKFMALQKGFKLSQSGEYIADKRGVKFVKAGKVETVAKLGTEPDGPLMEDVTPEQFEVMRIEAMPDDEKQTELTAVTDVLAGQAASMRQKLEIQGVPDALKQSQDWYNAELTIVTEKYN